MRSGPLKLNFDKTDCVLVTENITMRRDIEIIRLSIMPVQLYSNVRNLGFIFDEKSIFNEQINSVKRKLIVKLFSFSRIAKFIVKDSKIELVHGLVLSIVFFCNSLYYGLLNVMLNDLKNLINSAARIVVCFPKFSRGINIWLTHFTNKS